MAYQEPDRTKVRLMTATGEVVDLSAVAGQDTLLIDGVKVAKEQKMLAYSQTQPLPAGEKEVENRVEVPRGAEFCLSLADGSRVWLNSDSEIRYPVAFGKDRRTVFLSGEAYFDVVQDEAHPFIVDMGNSSVRVLGTSFDVRAYADEDEVLTTLVQGSVKFSAGKEFVTLEPGKQAVLGKSGSIETREVDTYLYTAWKEGVFAFKRQRLEEIMKVVARWYDVNIFWENVSQKEVTFTGKMKRYDDFSKVVEVLEMTGNTEFVIKENNIFIREK